MATKIPPTGEQISTALAEVVIGSAPVRLRSGLASGTTIAASGSAEEEVVVAGLGQIRVRYKLAGTGLDETVELIPILASGGEATTGTASDSAASSGTERALTLELVGEELLKVKITNNNGAEAITVNYVEVAGE